MNDWLNQLGGILQQYANSGQPTQSTENDFEQAASVAPRDAMAGGLADAFRSDQTPPFPSMLGQMFGNSTGTQRANILNMLLSTAGPALLSSILQRGGGMGNLGGLLQGGQVTPQVAEQIPPQAVEELAREAEQRDPSVIDRVSDFYAEHPTLVKSLGAAALAIAMSGMTKQRRGLF
jgi:hypothetical protein